MKNDRPIHASNSSFIIHHSSFVLRRPGFTLLEVTVAMAILSVLLVGMGSAVMIARRAVPDTTKGNSAGLSAGGAMDRLAADLFYATSILTSSPTELVFLVADRNGDGAPETIRYYWSGTRGAPLVRQVNGGNQATLLDSVQEFCLSFAKRSEPLPATYTDADEVLLAKCDKVSNLGSIQVNQNDWCGEYFRPSLPAQTTSWRVTRVQFNARISGASDGELRVQLRPAVGVLPGATVLADVSVMENTLSSGYQWKEVAFSDVSGLAPGSGLCLVLKGAGSGDAAEVRIRPHYSYSSDFGCVVSTNGGLSWSSPAGQQMLFYVYGKVSTPNPVGYRYLLTGVQATLRSGNDAISRIQTSIQVVNRPEVPGP